MDGIKPYDGPEITLPEELAKLRRRSRVAASNMEHNGGSPNCADFTFSTFEADCIVGHYISACRELAAAVERAEKAETYLQSRGYVRCDIPACNCSSWHPRYGLYERMREIEAALDEAGHPLSNENGNLVLNALRELIAAKEKAEQERDELVKQFETALDDVDAGLDKLLPVAQAVIAAKEQAERERDEHVRWMREMCADYRLAHDAHDVSMRLAINGFIHDLRAQLAAAERAEKAERERDEAKGAWALLMQIARDGGSIYCTSMLSPSDIAECAARGRLFVTRDGIGFAALPGGK